MSSKSSLFVKPISVELFPVKFTGIVELFLYKTIPPIYMLTSRVAACE